jgi:hypothetical protein
VLARDRTGMTGQLRGAIDHFKLACTAGACLAEALEKVASLAPVIAQTDPHAAAAVRKMAREVERLGKSAGAFKEAQALPKPKDDPWPTSVPDSDHAKQLERAGNEFGAALEKDESAWSLVGPTSRGVAHGALFARQELGNLAFRDAPAAFKQFTRHGDIGQLLEPTAIANKSRAEGHALNREQVASATRAMATVQRLMAQDEILSTKDPEKVFEAFNTIRSASPEVAGDMSLLRIMLRNALDYQGVDIDTASAARKFQQSDRAAAKPERA